MPQYLASPYSRTRIRRSRSDCSQRYRVHIGPWRPYSSSGHGGAKRMSSGQCCGERRASSYGPHSYLLRRLITLLLLLVTGGRGRAKCLKTGPNLSLLSLSSELVVHPRPPRHLQCFVDRYSFMTELLWWTKIETSLINTSIFPVLRRCGRRCISQKLQIG
jgi:hypothetical protein